MVNGDFFYTQKNHIQMHQLSKVGHSNPFHATSQLMYDLHHWSFDCFFYRDCYTNPSSFECTRKCCYQYIETNVACNWQIWVFVNFPIMTFEGQVDADENYITKTRAFRIIRLWAFSRLEYDPSEISLSLIRTQSKLWTLHSFRLSLHTNITESLYFCVAVLVETFHLDHIKSIKPNQKRRLFLLVSQILRNSSEYLIPTSYSCRYSAG